MTFGIIAPALCFVFDPIVFKASVFGAPLYPQYQLPVYLFSGLQILVLIGWLLSGGSFRNANGVMSGALSVGALFCLICGLVLLPFSLLGLTMGIGVFGFTPFLTALVYFRNGLRAWNVANHASLVQVAMLMLGTALALAAPTLLTIQIRNFFEDAVSAMVKEDAQHARAAARELRPFGFLAGPELDRLAQSYLNESDPSRKQILQDCYREVTGLDITTHVQRMMD